MKGKVLHSSMRAHFAHAVHKEMKRNTKIWIIVNDLGYKMWDKVRADFADRFINCGAAEQAMMGMAVGLALSGKIPIVYSITTFLLYRPFETIRNYIHHEKIPVILVGGGRKKDYEHDGISHWVFEDKEIMKILSNVKSVWPQTNDEIHALVNKIIKSNLPWYINLKR